MSTPYKGPTKIMIIRHAEKPGLYDPEKDSTEGKILYNGINAFGQQDSASLVTLGWERAGGIGTLFYPNNNGNPNPLYPGLAIPNFIYASNPFPTLPPLPIPVPLPVSPTIERSGNMWIDEASQRPYQTISALYARMVAMTADVTLNTNFVANNYAGMVADVLTKSKTVLIAWQHQDILIKKGGKDCIVNEIINQLSKITGTTVARPLNIPSGPWPGDRYDMVFVLDISASTGAAAVTVTFTQVPQLLLAGDSAAFPLNGVS